MTQPAGRPVVRKRAKKSHKEDPYELPTAEKRAFGDRMKTAREAAGLSQIDAANAMGYSKGVQLSNMEAGNRPPNLRALMEAARVYGTTMDYLCGFTDDYDRDPATAAVRHVSSSVSAVVQRLIAVMVDTSVVTARKLLPTAGEGQRLAAMLLEIRTAMETFKARNKAFDRYPAAATLDRRIEVASEAARAYVVQFERAQRVLQARVGHGEESAQISLLPTLDRSMEKV